MVCTQIILCLNDQAQNAIDLYISMAKEDQAQAQARWQEQSAQWAQKSNEAGLLSKTSRDEAANGLRAVDKDGSLGETLHQLGLDKHPGIIEAFRSHGAAG